MIKRGERVASGESLWTTADAINYRVENYLKSKSKNWPNCGILMINFAGGGDSMSGRNCAPYLVYTTVCKNPGVVP